MNRFNDYVRVSLLLFMVVEIQPDVYVLLMITRMIRLITRNEGQNQRILITSILELFSHTSTTGANFY